MPMVLDLVLKSEEPHSRHRANMQGCRVARGSIVASPQHLPLYPVLCTLYPVLKLKVIVASMILRGCRSALPTCTHALLWQSARSSAPCLRPNCDDHDRQTTSPALKSAMRLGQILYRVPASDLGISYAEYSKYIHRGPLSESFSVGTLVGYKADSEGRQQQKQRSPLLVNVYGTRR